MKNNTISSLLLLFLFLVSCSSSRSVITTAKEIDISQYKYVVFGSENEGDEELADIIMMVQNDISEKLQVVPQNKVSILLQQDERVLSPEINVKTETFDGGHTYITINFYDYRTKQNIAIVKSSGIGFTISQDQKLACKAIKKELDKIFK